MRGGKVIRYKVLSDIWKYFRDEKRDREYVRTEVIKFMMGL